MNQKRYGSVYNINNFQYKYLDHCKTMSSYTDDYKITEITYGRKNQIGEDDHHTITCSFIGKGEEEGLIYHKYIHISEKRFKIWFRDYKLELIIN